MATKGMGRARNRRVAHPRGGILPRPLRYIPRSIRGMANERTANLGAIAALSVKGRNAIATRRAVTCSGIVAFLPLDQKHIDQPRLLAVDLFHVEEAGRDRHSGGRGGGA